MRPRLTDVLEPGTKVTDKVTLVRLLGEGAMGEVWVAEHQTLKNEVAVKFIAPHMTRSRIDALERFTGEATAAAQIKSPHVVQMLDHGVMAGGTPYIVMELLDGESLHDRIDRLGWLSIEDSGQVITQTSRALSAAHKLGVIHRDIKPHNIFLVRAHGEEIFVKILDYGVAKQTKRKKDQELTEPGTIVGTPQYVSRDLIMSGQHKKIDERVDLWSLAIVAYKCLTRALPFDGDSIAEICAALAAGNFAAPSSLRPELGKQYDAWFQRALHPDPQERFATADELSASFVGLAKMDGRRSSFRPRASSASRASTLVRTKPRSSSRMAAAVTALAGVLALGGGLALSFSTSTPATGSTIAANAGGAGATPSEEPPSPSGTVALPRASTAASADASAAPSALPSDVPSALPSASASGAPNPRLAAPRAHEVVVPAGQLWMGCEKGDLDCDDDELPLHQIAVSAFYIDRYEVRVVDYARCVVAGHCSTRRLNGYAIDGGRFVASKKCNWAQPHRERNPINCVSYADASEYCQWVGARLPTEAEWERAARGDDHRQYPWGDDTPNCIFSVMTEEGDEGCGKKGTFPVGAKAKDKSPFGVLDLAGNVREWVADWYDPAYYAKSPAADPRGPEGGGRRVARGGSFGTAVAHLMRISNRQSYKDSTRDVHVGFRCARTAPSVDRPPDNPP